MCWRTRWIVTGVTVLAVVHISQNGRLDAQSAQFYETRTESIPNMSNAAVKQFLFYIRVRKPVWCIPIRPMCADANALHKGIRAARLLLRRSRFGGGRQQYREDKSKRCNLYCREMNTHEGISLN